MDIAAVAALIAGLSASELNEAVYQSAQSLQDMKRRLSVPELAPFV